MESIERGSDLMQLTTNYGFKKPEGNDNVNVDDLNYNMDIADAELKKVNEQLGEKVKYTDLTPIVTTGTSSAYIATIPTNMVEVTIVPHINNLQGATLNGIAILDREGKPIEKDTLVANIPTKIVRVGSNFFIASGGGLIKVPPYILNYAKGTINKILPLPFIGLDSVAQNMLKTAVIIADKLYIVYVDDGSYRPRQLTVETIDLATLVQTKEVTVTEATPCILITINNIVYLVGSATAAFESLLRSYNPITKEYTSKSMGGYIPYHAAVAVKDSKIYCVGGWISGTSTPRNTLFIVDVTLSTRTLGQSIPTGRQAAIAARVDNKIYVMGGSNNNNDGVGSLQTNECYDILTGTWTAKANIPARWVQGGSKVVDESNILILTKDKLQYSYDSVLDTWTQLENINLPTYSSINGVGEYTDAELLLTTANICYLYKY